VILRFLLAGAYHPDARLLEPRRLDVQARLALGTLHLAPFRMDLRGIVDIAGMAAHAEATGELRVAPPSVHYRWDFRAQDGRPLSLVLSQSLARIDVRSLTELSGHLVRTDDGTALGSARLRFDARRALGL
jgi:hypothetical protein